MDSTSSVAQAVMAALAQYRGGDRLYWLELDGAAAELVVERWQGWECLSQGSQWTVDVLSTDAHLPLEAMLGRAATLWTRGADGGRLPRSGLVRQAECVGADGGLARYRLALVSWTWLLGQGRHSRVFQDKTVLEIVAAVFAGYAPLAQWQVGDEVGPFLAAVPALSYCVQYRESDFDFVARLLAEHGLGWRLEEAAGDGGSGVRLVLFAASGDGPQDATAARGGGIRFHRSDATESSDSIQALGRSWALDSTALTLLSHDYKTAQALSTAVSLGDGATALEVYDPSGAYAFASASAAARAAGLLAEAREARRGGWFGHSSVRSLRAGQWFAVTQAPADAAGAPGELLPVAVRQCGVNNLPDVVREGAAQLLGPFGGVRDAEPGVDAGADLAYGLGGDRCSNPGAGPDLATTVGAEALFDAGAWSAVLARAAAVGYANVFLAVPRAMSWRPVLADETGARLNPRPTAPGYQSAIVVGPEGRAQAAGSGELHADALGRVRVRFHFQADGGVDTANDSCWLRVTQRYAGPGVGSQFLPRIGQEVLVGFLDGDIDRPIVVGALYNGHGEAGIAPSPGAAADAPTTDAYSTAGDHRPSAQANAVGGHAPAWHGMSPDTDGHRNAAALSGFKSKEFGGDGHNRLVFDDSDGQLRLQLATTQAATELNLGHLIHQADNYRGSFRGEGFELRSDRWGAVRGERGLWVSAYANDAEAPAGEHVAATALLRQATQLAEAFSPLAGTHLASRLAAHEGVTRPHASALIDTQAPLPALLTSTITVVAGSTFDAALATAVDRAPEPGDGRVPHSGDALLGLSAPAGIGLVAGQSLHWSVGETLTLASGRAGNAAIAGDLRVHAGQSIGWLAGAVEAKQPGAAHSLALVSGEGELDLQAQTDQIKLQSRDGLALVSANAEVELAAGKTVHLATSGGASITIEGGNIVIACPGQITVHAGKKSFVGPTQLSREMNSWPETRFDQRYVIRHRATGEPMANTRVEVIRADGARMEVVTDSAGRLPMQKGSGPERINLRVLGAV